ncbi:MAG: cellulase family glycosylhydrolase [Lachnospiraceae bacterium]|nr:cellulase family glycosylhydrolase [Lachnospiraceae bacterium]
MAEENNGSKKKLIIFAIAAVCILAAGILIGVLLGSSKDDKNKTVDAGQSVTGSETTVNTGDNSGTKTGEETTPASQAGDNTSNTGDTGNDVTETPGGDDNTTPTPDTGDDITPTQEVADNTTPTPDDKATPTPDNGKATPTPDTGDKTTPTPKADDKVTPTPDEGKVTPTPDAGDDTTPTPTEKETPSPTEKETPTPTEKATPTPTSTDNGGKGEYVLTYTTDNSWQDGSTNMFGVQFGITNGTDTAVKGWKLEMVIDGLSTVSGWNGTFKTSGNTMTVTDAGYNSDIYANGTIVIGCNLGTTSKTVTVSSAKLNGKPMTVKSGKVDQNDPGLKNDGGNGGGNGGNGGNGGGSDKKGQDLIKEIKENTTGKKGDDWLHTDGKNILDKDGKKVWLTGLNWFGYNTGTNTFDGLWNSQLAPTVKAIADHGFNLIRVPISAQLINQWAAGEYPKANYNNAYNTELNSMNSLEIFDYFLALAEQNGIKVMPDIHSAETNASGHNVNLWYTDKVKVNDFYHALEWMAERYKDNDTIIAFDLKNEPHGKPYEGDGAAIWNDSKKANNWKYVAETAAAKILAKNPNVLIMVEGIEIYPIDIKKNSDYSSTNDKDYYFNWWGGNLRGVADYPINLGKYQNKLVYSPHDYGPTVYEQPWFEGKYTYDSLMKDCWHDNWFFIYEKNIAPLLIGEWGGFMREPNLTWMTYMRQLIKKYHLNHTFWCLNANSGDTGGLLLDDFTTWDTEKYNFVKEVLWQEGGKFVGLDHEIPLGKNGITLKAAKGIS